MLFSVSSKFIWLFSPKFSKFINLFSPKISKFWFWKGGYTAYSFTIDMMKKEYKTPKAEVIELKQNSSLLAGSTPGYGGQGSGSGDAPLFEDDLLGN